MKIKKYYPVIIKTFILFLFIQTSVAAQVNVILQQPPPFQFKLEHLWKVTLINPTPVTYNVYLTATAAESSEGEIVEATTAVFTLAPGMKAVNTRELLPMDINVKNDKYTDVIQKINTVPTGEYEICISVINAETGIPLGTQCILAQTQNISQVELLQPENNSRFFSGGATESTSDNSERANIIPGSFITFNWLSPSPVPPGVILSYSIKIVEMYGSQSSYDAMLSNPAFYRKENIYSNIWVYPVEGRMFENNRRYAWQVKAYLNNILMSESEVWEFLYTGNSQLNKKSEETSFSDNPDGKGFDYFKTHLLLASIDNDQILSMISDNETEYKTEPVSLSGSAKLNFDGGYKIVPFSDKNGSNLTAELNPEIAVYGIPFYTNILLSTLQETNAQSMNNWSLNYNAARFREMLQMRLDKKINDLENGAFDYINIEEIENYYYKDSLNINLDSLRLIAGWRDELRQRYVEEQSRVLSDPEKLSENLDQYGMISEWEKFLLSINTLGIGTNYPGYSDFTLEGVPVTGVNVEMNPGIFYMAFSGSKNLRAIESISYRRDLYAGRFGFGEKEGSHLFFTGLYVKDDENSINANPDNSVFTPKANYVFGTETRLSFFNSKLLIEGEGAASVFTRDTRDADLEIKGMPGWVKGLVNPKISSSFDYSYSGKISYSNSESATRVSFNMKMVGPGYITLGAPNLRNDQFAYEAKAEQKFYQRHISVSAFFKNSHDNLIEWKRSRTTVKAFGISLGLNFPLLPYIQLSYSPYLQENDDADPFRKIENKLTMLSAVTGYTLFIGKFNFSTNVAYTNSDSKTLNEFSDFKTNSISVTEVISFNEPVSFAVTWGSIKTSSFFVSSSITNFDFSINASIIESLTNTLGLSFATESDLNKKNGYYFDTAFSPWDNLSLQGRIEGATYVNLVNDDFSYNELLFRIFVNIYW